MVFQNRVEAGILLGQALKEKNYPKPFIFGLARGGVIVAKEIASLLGAPLDVLIVRKLGAPQNPELGFGAIAPQKTKVIDQNITKMLSLEPSQIEAIIERESQELARRENLYRKNRPYPNLAQKTAILVDDGIATGVSILATIDFVKKLSPQKIIIAAPVCAQDTLARIKPLCSEIVCLFVPEVFWAVGQFYQEFSQTSDQEVILALKKAKEVR